VITCGLVFGLPGVLGCDSNVELRAHQGPEVTIAVEPAIELARRELEAVRLRAEVDGPCYHRPELTVVRGLRARQPEVQVRRASAVLLPELDRGGRKRPVEDHRREIDGQCR